MDPKTKRARVVIGSSVAALVAIAAVWWWNGAEMEDSWLYLTSAVVVVLGMWSAYPKNK